MLLAGGSNGTILTEGTPPDQTSIFVGIATAEIYDAASKNYSCVGGVSKMPPACNNSMVSPRISHVAAALQDGRVLLAGGVDNAGNVLNTAELYDPKNGTFTQTGSMNTERKEFAGALFTSGPLTGQVLVSGGVDNKGNFLSSAELYDPSKGTFTTTGSMLEPRFLQSEAVISGGSNNGDILVLGGSGDQTAEIYVPAADGSANGTFKAASDMTDIVFQANIATLSDEEILVAGGATINSQDQLAAVAGAELYDPTNNRFSATDSMSTGRWMAASAFLDPSLVSGSEAGEVLIAGGEGVNSTLASSELFVPGTTTSSTSSAAFAAATALTPAQKREAVVQAIQAVDRLVAAGQASHR